MAIETNGQFWREVGPWRSAAEHNTNGDDCWCNPRVINVPGDIPEYLIVRDGAFMQHIQDDGQDSFNGGFDNGWREAVEHLTQMQSAGLTDRRRHACHRRPVES